MDQDALVQPIVALNDGIHENAVLAVAMASVTACADPNAGSWKDWLAGRFTKTVRRMKEKDFQKLLSSDYLRGELDAGRASVARYGDNHAVAFAPMRYSEFPSILKRAQVSGFDLPRDDYLIGREVRSDAPSFYVNESLEMSTGKECAQVAHAYWIAALENSWDFSERDKFPTPNVEWLSKEFFDEMRERVAVIVTDAGLTEFDGVPTETVLINFWE